MDKYINLAKAWSFINYENIKSELNKKTFNEKNTSNAMKIANEIEESGLVVIEDYYTEKQCNEIIDEIEIILKEGKANAWQDPVKSDTRIYASHLYSDPIQDFHSDPFLKEIGELYLETELLNSHTLAGKLVAKKDNLGSGQGWHRDSVYIKQFKSILYLTDVNIKNGPFEYILNTHQKSSVFKSIKNSGFSAHQNRMDESQIQTFLTKNPEFKSQINTAKKGSLILVDTGGIHRGMPIIEGERYALTNYFFPVHQYSESQRKKFEALF